MYECHVTLHNPNKEICELIAKDFKWKTSEIERDPVLGNDTFFYFTSHSKNFVALMEEMQELENQLTIAEQTVIRKKIELIIYDTKTGIGQ